MHIKLHSSKHAYLAAFVSEVHIVLFINPKIREKKEKAQQKFKILGMTMNFRFRKSESNSKTS